MGALGCPWRTLKKPPPGTSARLSTASPAGEGKIMRKGMPGWRGGARDKISTNWPKCTGGTSSDSNPATAPLSGRLVDSGSKAR